MSIRRWVHLFAMLVPVGVLTVFNVLGIKPTTELLAALSTMTATAAAVAGAQVMHASTGRALPAARPARRPQAPRKKKGPDATRDHASKQLPAPARVVGVGDDDGPA